MVLKIGSEAEARKLLVKLGLDPDEYLGEMEKVKKKTDEAKKEIKDFGDKSEQATKKTTKSVKETGSSVEQLTGKLKKLALTLGAFELLRRVGRFFLEAATAGLEFTQSMFTLEVAIRGLQRTGLDTTIDGWIGRLADLKKEFPIFSKKAFVDAASLAALMTREFGFTEEQIASVVRQSVILAQITGKDLAEAVRGITYAIGSGYFESLQRAGINISRQVIAEEALRRGYEGSYTALSQNIRAMITYEIVQSNLNAISEDASRIIETTTGQAQRMRASLEDLIMTLGLMITNTDEAKDALGSFASIIEFVTEVLDLYGAVGKKYNISIPTGPFGADISQLVQAWADMRQGWEAGVGYLKEIKQLLIDIGVIAPPEPILGDVLMSFGGMEVEAGQDRFDELEEALNKAIEGTADIEAEGREKESDIKEKYWKDLEDKYARHMQKMEDIKLDYDQKLTDIDLKESRAVADAQMDYAYRVAEAARQAAFRKEEAERRYREREIQAEKRFQEKMRQLRENFILNLEDAVRERDALQIIRLTRQYNLRKTQMGRENKLSGGERSDAFQEQLRQIEQQRLERQRQLAIEHQRRLEDIARQAERERIKAALDFERKKEDEKVRAEDEATARTVKFKADMLALDEQIQERIDKLLAGLQKEYSLSKAELEAIDKLYYNIYLDANSSFNKGIDHAIIRLAQLNAMHQRVMALLFRTIPGQPTPAEARGHAEGGIVIANKPTTVTFGEAGPEIAMFTPLSRAGVNTGRVTGNLPAGLGGRMGGGKHTVGISLSPGLEGKIIDRTMDEMSEVLIKIERARV